jgi:hypothetical protein
MGPVSEGGCLDADQLGGFTNFVEQFKVSQFVYYLIHLKYFQFSENLQNSQE